MVQTILYSFFKIKIYGKPEYLLNKIPSSQNHCNTRNADQVETYYCRTDFFNISFFPYTIIEWNKLDIDILKSKSYATFRNILLKLGRPIQRPIYSISSPVGLKLLTRLRLGLSHLNEHRFNHNFQNCINPLCSCSLEIESTFHFLLHCHHYTNIRVTLLNSIAEIIGNTFNINDECLVSLLLFGSQKYLKQIIHIQLMLQSSIYQILVDLMALFFYLQNNLILIILMADWFQTFLVYL